MSEENTQVAVIELPKELAELKSTAVGISVDRADQILIGFSPYMTRLTELSAEMDKINFETPSDFDAEMAESLRKKLVKVRTGSDEEKDKQKELIRIEDKLIQSSFNLIKSACELKENRLKEAAQFRQRELERLQAIKLEERKALLEPFNAAFDPITLGAMSDDVFANYLTGVKTNYVAQKLAEAKAEEQRIEQERIVQLHNTRKEALVHVWGFLSVDQRTMNFGILSSEDFTQLLSSSEANKMADELAREKERAEAARLKKEREEIEAKAKQEREAAEKLLREQQEKAQKEKEAAELKAKKDREALEQEMKKKQQESDAKLAMERAERARIEREAKEKEELAQKQKDAEEKARKLAEKKAKAAPDKEKIEIILAEVNALSNPVMKSDEGKNAMWNITQALNLFKQAIQMEISKL